MSETEAASPRAQSTRARILDAASTVMTERGLANATTKEIARAAGFSEATLYKHFQDKEELFLTVMRERLPAEFVGYLAGLADQVGTGTVRVRLQEVAAHAVAFYRDLAPMLGAVFAQPDLLARHQQMLRAAGLGPHLALSALADYLHAEQRLGRLIGTNRPDMLAAALLGACFQRAFLIEFEGEHLADQPADEFARALVDSLLPE
ncbi:TetR/AcrR family transcriptional regulator [Nocardia vaccinii]|uniref:TetR/AcrR family transcriptional regulator n=1 Tax=Nocardia vaccinii TaxID=1822 RepID=UPI00082D3F2F|nr:TetR/AcrR family transcriptional regulator [Nocardia vaccinii]